MAWRAFVLKCRLRHYYPIELEDAERANHMGSRPYCLILGYPVISPVGQYAKAVSREYLLGYDPDATLVTSLSARTQATKKTPPTVTDDGTVSVIRVS